MKFSPSRYHSRGGCVADAVPFVWVGQKNRYLRQLLIKDIEQTTSRRLIVYFANRYSPEPEIAASDVAYMHEILSNIGGEPVDLLLETVGEKQMPPKALSPSWKTQ